MLLNELVKRSLVASFDGSEVELDLASDLSREYPDDQVLESGIDNLFMETEDYRGDRVKLVTRKQGSSEVLEILSSGGTLYPHLIDELNASYREGEALETRPAYSGARIAAFQIAKFGGKVFIENIDSPPYDVMNYVQFD